MGDPASQHITLQPGGAETLTVAQAWSPERVIPMLLEGLGRREPPAESEAGGKEPPRRHPLNVALVAILVGGALAAAYHQLDGRTAQLERQQQWMIFAIEAIARATGAELPSQP